MVALDFARMSALVLVFWNHAMERSLGALDAGNPGASWGSFSSRIREWWPTGGSALTSVLRDSGSLGDQAVGVFILITGAALSMSAARRHESLIGAQRRSWWRRHYRGIATSWVLANFGVMLVSWVLHRAQGSPAQWQFWAGLAGIRFLPSTIYYGLAPWWYLGLLVQLYLLFPNLCVLMQRWGVRRFLSILVPACLAVRLVGLFVFRGGWLDVWSRGGFALTRLPEFLVGMALGAWLAGRRSNDIPLDLHIQQALTPGRIALGAVFWLVGVGASFTLVGMAFAPLLLAVGMSVLLFAVGCRLREGRVLAWWVTRGFDFYLIHYLPCLALIHAWTSAANSVVRVAAALIGSLVAGEVLHQASRLTDRVLPR